MNAEHSVQSIIGATDRRQGLVGGGDAVTGTEEAPGRSRKRLDADYPGAARDATAEGRPRRP